MAKPLPKYRHFRPSNLAFVEIAGKRVCLGQFGSDESKERYRQILEELRHRQDAGSIAEQVAVPASAGLTVAELCLGFLQWAAEYYVKDGRRASEYANYRLAIRPLRTRFGGLPVALFTPGRFVDYRTALEDSGINRKTGLEPALKELLEADALGDPEAPLRWTSRGTSRLAAARATLEEGLRTPEHAGFAAELLCRGPKP